MDYYLDIRFLGDYDLPVLAAINVFYSKLHGILALQKRCDVGVSFPNFRDFRFGLGDMLRLHGSEKSLRQLVQGSWISKGIENYIIQGNIKQIPSSVDGGWVVRRVQTKSNAARERARLMRRKNITDLEAYKLIPDSIEKRLLLPFITLYSKSTGQKFRLFISQKQCPNIVDGIFNSYALSMEATVPRF